jgi:putative ABC transport system substrate-binding protein
MKKLLRSLTALVTVGAMLTTGCGSATDSGTSDGSATASKDSYNIGIIQLTEHPALDAAKDGFIEGMSENGLIDGENITVDLQNAQNDQSNLKTIAQKFVSDKKDLVLAIATPAAQSIAAETTDIPILITAVTDPAASGLCETNEQPGGNVTGTSDLTPIKEQIELLHTILPDAKNIAIMYNSGEQNSVIQADMAEAAATELGIQSERKTVTNTNDVAQVTSSLIGKFDAVYIPTDNTLASAMPLVSSITNPAGLPLIVGEQGMVEGGGLASVAVSYSDLGKMTGKMAAEILLNGADPATMPIEYTENPQLIVNPDAAAELGIVIPTEVMDKAEQVNTVEQ